MTTAADRRALLDLLTIQAADESIRLDDTRDPEARRVGESGYTSTELLTAERCS